LLHFCLLRVALQPKTKGLHVPSIGPSQATSEYVKENQSDPNYYTPCSNDFLLQSHLLAYEDIDVKLKVPNDLCTEIQRIHSDINSAFYGEDHGVGYLGQKGLHDEGITALLTSNLHTCFMNYSIHRGNSMVKKVCIMHQSSIRDENNLNYYIGIMLCYRQENTHLLPLIFFEFTKTSTKTIDGKESQAAIYANHLMRVLWGKYQHSPLALSSSTSTSSSTSSYTHALPQMGIIMSEKEMLLKLYTKTTINKGSNSEDRIAEKNILRCELNAANLERLLYIMYGWVNYCIEQMTSSKDITLKLRSKKESNVIDLGEVIVKSYDYRSISGRKRKIERSPQFYTGRFQNFRYLVKWQDAVEPLDSLIIVQYDKVKGTHMPTCVGHLKNLLTELQCLHNEFCIVHGDIRLSNVIFSTVSNQSDDEIKTTLIDFDFSGLHEDQTYPSRYNLDIGDGSRHADARSGCCLKYEHDVYSAFWIIEKYQTIHGQQFDTTDKKITDIIHDLSQLDEREEIVSKATNEAMDTEESGSPMLEPGARRIV
jgi:hypothetical protein